MILGLGIDLIEVSRFERHIARHGEDVIEQVLSAPEMACCRRARHPHRAYATRFAAKEAFLKALGTGLAGGISWHDAEVEGAGTGRPRLTVRGLARRRLDELGATRVHLDLTHTARHAAAVVVLEG